MQTISSRLFTWRQIVIFTAVFLGGFVLVQRSLRFVCAKCVTFDCPDYWPVSIFSPRFPSPRDLAVVFVVAIAFFFIVRLLELKRFHLAPVCISGVLLISGLTFIHGIDIGFYAPIAGDAQTGTLVPFSVDGQEYYHDALTIADPMDFLRRYNQIQPTLHRHAHTHPPGAVLTFYLLQHLSPDPAVIAMIIMIIATVSTIFFFYRLMGTQIDDETARYMAFLIVLLPAVQIYYLATLDALITALLTGTLYYFCFGSGKRAVITAAVMLAVSFLLTFVSLFILPVLVGFDLIVKRSLKRSVIVIGFVAIVHILVYFLTGYDAAMSFRTASHFENPQGLMLLVDPLNYLFTRLEDVAEILFFFGPFLLVLFVRGLKDIRQRPLNVLTLLGCATVLAMYVAGAWRTGETARACAFIYPFLLFPVGYYLNDREIGPRERMQLAGLVFFQAIGMQTFGNYLW